jgi:hypothetical protein
MERRGTRRRQERTQRAAPHALCTFRPFYRTPRRASGPREVERERTGTRCCRCGTLFVTDADARWREGRNDRGARTTRLGHPRPAIGALFRTRAAVYMPAARSWSRSRRDVAGECCGRFSPSGAGASSWRCRATVRLATMAAMAMRLTPKVRISPLHLEGSWRAVRCDLLPNWQIPCRTIVRYRAPVRGVTKLLHNLPSLLAIHPYNA